MSISSRESVILHFSSENPGDWMNGIQRVLGSPEFVIDPQVDADCAEELMSFFLTVPGEEIGTFPELSGICLILVHAAYGENKPFAVDFRRYKKGVREESTFRDNVTEIDVDVTGKHIALWAREVTNDTMAPALLSLTSNGEMILTQ